MNAIDRNIAAAANPRPASTAWADALAATAEIERRPERLLIDIIDDLASTAPDAPALLSDTETFTFRTLAARAGLYFGWALSQGLKPGDRVALVMSNRPDYVAVWLGLSKAGVVTALINTSLAGASLLHCLSLAAPRHVIAESAFLDRVAPLMPELRGAVLWRHDDVAAEAVSTAGHGMPRPPVTISDTALLIYTSGTTGLPKAARVSHRRTLNWALWFKGLLGTTTADRMYDCLPLYHSVGGIVAVFATLAAGGSTVIAEKFSARRFWDDVARWNCTGFQYIGELCRYLVNAPDTDRPAHSLRFACGNGLREDVWTSFRTRFAIPQVVEFYAATEGSFSLFNVEGKPGAVGRVPSFLRHRFPTAIVKHDPLTGDPLRNAEGLCVKADVGEPGEAIGRIGSGTDGTGRFEGYTDQTESERKILRNVLAPGDAWFRTGDLMRIDQAGFYYFVDRVGDTFRWKGENVSTLEVANVLTGAAGVADAAVYGVSVPGADGKAGMAFLDTTAEFDADELLEHVSSRLPDYAVPLFLRLGQGVALTETFKHRKHELARQGFDPSATADLLMVRLSGRYVTLDPARYEQILRGEVRL